MKRRLLQILAVILCFASLMTCQILASDTGESGIMPLWDNAAGVYCEITFEQTGIGVLVGSVSARKSNTTIYARLELYRTHWLFGDTLLNYWTAADYDAVNFSETFTPTDGQEYKLVLTATVTYNGNAEEVKMTDVETYHASDS